MWIAFGVVSLVAVFAYRLWRKRFWAWGWKDDHGYLKYSGRPYKIKVSQRHKVGHVVSFSVECLPGIYFRIKRETKWDRYAKAIGLSMEKQVGDAEFDNQLYIVSDDSAWCDELGNRPELQRVIKALFADRRFISLTCEGCHLWGELEVVEADIPEGVLRGEERNNIVSALHSIADVLKEIDFSGNGRDKNRFSLRAAILSSLSSALLIVGLVEWFRIGWVERGQVMLDASGLFAFSFIAGAILLFVGLMATAAILRGSSYVHIVMLEMLASGGIGLLLTGYVFARDVNCGWDAAEAKSSYVSVSGKHQGHRRRYGTYYTLTLDGSIMNQGLPGSLEVPFSVYRDAEIGKPLIITIKPGFLGYRWIESIRPYESR